MSRRAAGVVGAVVGAILLGGVTGGAGFIPGLVLGAVIGTSLVPSEPKAPAEPLPTMAPRSQRGERSIEAFLADAVDEEVISPGTAERLIDFLGERRSAPAQPGRTPVPPAADRVTTTAATPMWTSQHLPRSSDVSRASLPPGRSYEVVDRQEGFVRLRLDSGRVVWAEAGGFESASVPPQPQPQRGPEAPSAPMVATPAPQPRPVRGPYEPVTPAREPEPRPPTFFDRLETCFGRLRHEIASDLAVHGFSYIGMGLTFAGVFGYLFFSFQDLDDRYQPIVEAVIPVVFFGWAWYLRRRDASIVARVLELLGGLVLPLIVYASLVDNAAVPPDLTGGVLVVGLVAVAALVAAGYAWWSGAHEASGLHYLVGPVLWLGALSAGFAFKTDEALVGPAITRLVSPQGATAAVGIALTLLVTMLVSDGRLTGPVALAAVPSVLIAYAITVGLSIGEDWQRDWPIIVAGAATLVSIEVLGRHFGRVAEARIVQPVVIAMVVAPLGLALGPGWAGAIAVIVYLAWFEMNLPEGRHAGPGPSMALVAIGVGLAVSFAEPLAAMIAFGVASVWAHVRRMQCLALTYAKAVLTGAAAVLPVGFGLALALEVPGDIAWL